MPLILTIVFFLGMEITSAYLGYTKNKSDNCRPKDEMERAKGWYEVWGDDWMFKCPNICPEEVKQESYYRMKLHQNQDKDMDWVKRIFPYSHRSYVLPNRSVWDEYWTKESGTTDYVKEYPWLEYPSDRDEYGLLKKEEEK